ncbi:MAG: hypothetical protein J6Z34_06120 [Clostridia bacterium]|nr:hypothetical protein [Clostridia bacterium]
MFTNKKNLRAFIVLTAVFLALIVNGLFTLGSVKNTPTSAWKSEPGVAGNSTYFPSSVILEVTATDENGNTLKTVDEDDKTLIHAWVHVGKISKSNIKPGYGVISFQWNSTGNFLSTITSNTFTVEVQSGVDSAADQHQYGWYETPMTKFYRYCKISTNDIIDLNEVVFTNDYGEMLSVKLYGATEWKNGSFDPENVVLANDLSEASTAGKIIDEQKLFKEYSSMTKKYNFTSDEAKVVNAALTSFGGEGSFVNKNVGPFGVELVAVGLAVFGINTLGVRIVPYLFFILTVALLFALGRRIFKDTDAGLILSVLYVLSGLGLSVGSVGSVVSIGVFFAVLSVYFMYAFYDGVKEYYFTKEKRSFTVGATTLFVPILLSALAFSFAFGVSVAMSFVLPAVITIFAAGTVKIVKVHKYNASLVQFEDEKVRNDRQYKVNIIGSAISFVGSFAVLTFLFTVLFYGILGATYTTYYNTDNLLSAISLNMKGSLFVKDGAPAGTFPKWLAGGGSAIVYTGNGSGAFGDVYIGMNVIAQFISLTAFLFTTFVVIAGKCFKDASPELIQAAKTYFTEYLILSAGWVCSWILFAFVKGNTVSDYLLPSIFAAGLTVLCYKMLSVWDQKLFTVKGKAVTLSSAFIVCSLALCALFFVLGYAVFAGIEVSSVAASILFRWWLW